MNFDIIVINFVSPQPFTGESTATDSFLNEPILLKVCTTGKCLVVPLKTVVGHKSEQDLNVTDSFKVVLVSTVAPD